MGWIYSQKSGKLWRRNPAVIDDGPVYAGYSGHGEGKNNPAMQEVRMVGPICVGHYLMSRFFDHPTKGPLVCRLTPLPDTNTFGRDGFMLHGDSIKDPGTASEGCIIQSHIARQTVKESEDYNLEVISGE